jgi:hypothetical protein
MLVLHNSGYGGTDYLQWIAVGALNLLLYNE